MSFSLNLADPRAVRRAAAPLSGPAQHPFAAPSLVRKAAPPAIKIAPLSIPPRVIAPALTIPIVPAPTQDNSRSAASTSLSAASFSIPRIVITPAEDDTCDASSSSDSDSDSDSVASTDVCITSDESEDDEAPRSAAVPERKHLTVLPAYISAPWRDAPSKKKAAATSSTTTTKQTRQRCVSLLSERTKRRTALRVTGAAAGAKPSLPVQVHVDTMYQFAFFMLGVFIIFGI